MVRRSSSSRRAKRRRVCLASNFSIIPSIYDLTSDCAVGDKQIKCQLFRTKYQKAISEKLAGVVEHGPSNVKQRENTADYKHAGSMNDVFHGMKAQRRKGQNRG